MPVVAVVVVAAAVVLIVLLPPPLPYSSVKISTDSDGHPRATMVNPTTIAPKEAPLKRTILTSTDSSS
jgi:hypothetical protein